MFQSVLMISAVELAEMMDDDYLTEEIQQDAVTTCAIPVFVCDGLYDADDMDYEARISRWMVENCGLNDTTIYIEVEVA